MQNYEEILVRQLAQHLICGELDDYEYKVEILGKEGDIGNQDQIRSLVEEYMVAHQA